MHFHANSMRGKGSYSIFQDVDIIHSFLTPAPKGNLTCQSLAHRQNFKKSLFSRRINNNNLNVDLLIDSEP